MTNEVRTTSATGGQKGVKDERFDLIPIGALTALARHYGVGARKYDDHQWRKGYEWSKSYAALTRHLTQWWDGEDIDEETGSNHMAAVAWHAFTLLTFIAEFPEFDDRFKRPIKFELDPPPWGDLPDDPTLQEYAEFDAGLLRDWYNRNLEEAMYPSESERPWAVGDRVKLYPTQFNGAQAWYVSREAFADPEAPTQAELNDAIKNASCALTDAGPLFTVNTEGEVTC